MRKQGMYLMQVQIKTMRFAILPNQQIIITLRVGRNSATTTFANRDNSRREADINSIIQLNIDSTALQAQRCSLTFSSCDNKKILGIALISIPKDKNLIQSTYRLTQNEDKRAEVELKIVINAFDSSASNKTPIMELNSQSSNTEIYKKSSSTKSINHIQPKIYINNIERIDSLPINVNFVGSMSKISDELSNVFSEERKSHVSKSFKIREEVRIIQISEDQVRRYKQEKQAYYQLYQIEKGKNQIAIKFISNLIKKITQKYPSLASSIVQSFQPKKSSIEQQSQKKNLKIHQNNDSVIVAQLQQANRGLHRQIDEYKKIVQQLKVSLPKKNENLQVNIKQVARPLKNSNFLTSGLLDFQSTVSRVGETSVIRPINSQVAPTKEQTKSNPALNIDFKKWINLSIEQRSSLQDILKNTNKDHKPFSQQNNVNLIKKIKVNIDKSFTSLLSKKQITRDVLITHKRQINRVIEQALISLQ